MIRWNVARFRIESGKWPTAIDHVFLAEAVQKIGRAMFGGEWSGVEPWTNSGPSATLRFEQVQRRIARSAARGMLQTATRAVEGGDTRPLQSSVWQTERLDPRFFCCQINPANPFSAGVAGDNYGYIFVTDESLKRLLKELTRPNDLAVSFIAAETACEKWLSSEIASSPNQRPQPKAKFLEAARSKFKGLSARAFDRAWKLATREAPAWRRGGAPKKTPPR